MKLLFSVAVATIFTHLGPPDRGCYRHHGRHRDVSGEVRLASGDSLGHSVNLAVTHVATRTRRTIRGHDERDLGTAPIRRGVDPLRIED